MENETINGVEYSVGTLPVFDQFHVGRRLAPFLSALVGSVAGGMGFAGSSDFDLLAMATPAVTKVLAEMSDEDSEYILRKCLKVCRRHQEKGWAPVMNSAGVLQFNDMDLRTTLTLTARVIQENLGSFFPTSQPASENVQE